MKYCIICCGGNIPFTLASEIVKENEVYLILVENFYEDKRLHGFSNIILPIGKLGKALSYLKVNNITNLIIIGNINMPNLADIKPDLQGGIVLSKILTMKNKGDDAILRIISNFFEKNGIQIIPATQFLKNNIQTKTWLQPDIGELEDIDFGSKTLDEISNLDIAQSIVVCNKRVIGIEGVEGTDELIKRCGHYLQNNRFQGKPILIKKPKKYQDLRLDTPTIGLQTVENLILHNFAGLATKTSEMIVLNQGELISILNKNNIFWYNI